MVALTLLRARAAAPEDGRPTLEALPLTSPISVDGDLSDDAWRRAAVGSGFVQHDPVDGVPATEDTEIRVAYTASTLYLAIHAFDSQPAAIVAKEMERDSSLNQDDSILVLLDTFLDRRNAFAFETNPNGARSDSLVTDEGATSTASGTASGRSRHAAPPTAGSPRSRFPSRPCASTPLSAPGGSTCSASSRERARSATGPLCPATSACAPPAPTRRSSRSTASRWRASSSGSPDSAHRARFG